MLIVQGVPMKIFVILVSASTIFIGTIYTLYSKLENKNQESHISESEQKDDLLSELGQLKSLLDISNISERNIRMAQFISTHMIGNESHIINLIGQLNHVPNRQLCYKLAFYEWQKFDVRAFSTWLKNKAPNLDFDSALINLLEQKLTLLTYRFNYADKISNEEYRRNHLTGLISDNISKDPESIILWSLEKNKKREKWFELSYEKLSIHSISDAITSLKTLKNGTNEQLHSAIQAIITHYQIGTSAQKNLLAIQSLLPMNIREELIGALLPLLIQEPNLKISDLGNLLEGLPPSGITNAFYEQVALNWASKDPQEAAKYVESLEGETKEIATNGVVTSWLQKDLEAADAWLKTIDGNVDLAANTLGRGSAMLGNHQIADEWISVIEDEHMKTVAILDVLHGWYTESPEAGIYHLVYQKHLTDEQKIELLQYIYPGEHFETPMSALDNIGRLEGLTPAF